MFNEEFFGIKRTPAAKWQMAPAEDVKLIKSLLQQGWTASGIHHHHGFGHDLIDSVQQCVIRDQVASLGENKLTEIRRMLTDGFDHAAIAKQMNLQKEAVRRTAKKLAP